MQEVEASVSTHSELKSQQREKREECSKEQNRPGFHSGQTGVWEPGHDCEARGLSRKVPGIRENGLEVGRKLTVSFNLKGIIKAHQITFCNIGKGHALGGKREVGRTQIQFSEVTKLCPGTKSGLRSLRTGRGRAHHSELIARP